MRPLPDSEKCPIPHSEDFTPLSLRGHEVRGVLAGSITRLFRPLPFPEWVVQVKSSISNAYVVGFSQSGKRTIQIIDNQIPLITWKKSPFWYVQENWCLPVDIMGYAHRYADNSPMYFFEADMDSAKKLIFNSRGTGYLSSEDQPLKKVLKWNPPKSMPREASRLLLQFSGDTTIKYIGNLTEEDALAAGISEVEGGFTCRFLPKFSVFPTALEAFRSLWSKTYGKTATSPFLSTASFERVVFDD